MLAPTATKTEIWCASLGEPTDAEKRDDARTNTYAGRPVRVGSVNGTVQAVKYGDVHVVLEDGSTAILVFEDAIAAAVDWEQQAQAAEAAPLLTPPSTPRRAKPSSPRGVDELRPPPAPRKSRAPPWPDGIVPVDCGLGVILPLAGAAFEPGGVDAAREGVGDLILDPGPRRRRHSYDDDPGGADLGREGIGVGAGDAASDLALVLLDPDPRSRRRPGHRQDAAPLSASPARLENRAGAGASGGLRPPKPLKDVNREPTLEFIARADAAETPKTKLKYRRAPAHVAARLFSSPSPSPPPSPAPSRGRSSSSSSETSAHNYDLNNKLLHGDVLQLFAAHADEFNCVNLVTALHQIAKRNLHCADDPRCDWLLTVVTSRVAEFTARELAGIALSCCVAGILEPTLADAIADVLLVQPSPEQLDEVLGSLGLSHLLAQRSVAEVVTLATGGLLNDADARENLGLDAEAAATLQLALTDVSDEFLDELGPKGRSSLYPVLLYLQVEVPRSRLLRVLAKRRAELRAAYVRDGATPSRGQKDVSNALDAIKWSHRYEWCTPEGLSLDMAQPSTKTAVEFDGPTHYLKSGRPNGATTFKTRLLEMRGWRVIHIPYFEWDELRTRNKKDYLRQKLGLSTPTRSRTSSITSGGSSPRSGRSRAGSIFSSVSSSDSSLGDAWVCSACTCKNPDPSHVRCYLCNMPRS